MSGLTAYRDSRLELGDMIRAALHLARGSGDEEAEKRARELLARLAADRFQLAVVGQFSRGKTTLMNALLGGAYLPMGALPVTMARRGTYCQSVSRPSRPAGRAERTMTSSRGVTASRHLMRQACRYRPAAATSSSGSSLRTSGSNVRRRPRVTMRVRE